MKTNAAALLKSGLWYVACLAFALFTVTPFLWAVASSLKPLNAIFADVVPFTWRTFIPSPLTFEAYTALLTGTNFPRAIGNTVFVAAAVVVCGLFISSLAGFTFAKLNFPGKNFLFILVMVSFMIPFEAIAIPLYNVVNTFGWLNSYYALIIPAIANGLTVFLFRQFFAAIPTELVEAAVVDGASMFRIYSTIFLPLSRPALLGGGLLLFVSQWESFLWPIIAASDPDLRVIQVALAYLNTQYTTLWNQLFAGTAIAAAIPLVLILPLQRYYVRSVSNTGIKG